MSIRLIREHLPWIAPTIAIVLAATGYFDRSSNDAADVTSQNVTRNATLSPTMPSSGKIEQSDQAAASLAALQSLSNVGSSASEATVQPVAAVAPAAPAQPRVIARAEPQPVSPAPAQRAAVQAEISPTENPTAFFGAAQARLAAASCAKDLRSLSREAKVYFPAGGLTAEAAGIEQARVIGIIAQECPGVTIQVEGHSDPSGNPAVNTRLSQQRAEAVISRISAAGIDTSRFVAKGMGSSKPSGVTGPQGQAYYDRRVEFSIVETARTASLSSSFTSPWRQSACATDLQRAVDQTKIIYAPRSVSVSQADMNAVMHLASKAVSCPDARLRVIGQHSDAPGSGETPGTGRLRALVVMSSLVNAGYDSEQIIIAAPSRSIRDANHPDLSDSRLDFDVILDN